MAKYVLSVDQSTQGTKALVFDEAGKMLARADLPHKQIINGLGWVSHDPGEIYRNTLKAMRMASEKAGIDPARIACMGISNQRETTAAWDRSTGKPVSDAIVWQCARAVDVCAEVEKTGIADTVRSHTGIPVSPYFPAAKMAWILQNIPEARALAERPSPNPGPTSLRSPIAPFLSGDARTYRSALPLATRHIRADSLHLQMHSCLKK